MHRTRCDFRALHLQGLSALFVQVVHLARECGLVNRARAADDLETNEPVVDIPSEIKLEALRFLHKKSRLRRLNMRKQLFF